MITPNKGQPVPSDPEQSRPAGRTLQGNLENVMSLLPDIVPETRQTIAIIGLLLLLLLAVFSVSLRFIPANGDELRLLSSVAHTANPFEYFAKDAGEGKPEYRPLLSISLWVAYKMVGVKASVNQAINLVLHFMNVCLLFQIIRRFQPDKALLFLLPAIFLVSINTVSPASWVADRPTLLVGLFLLLVMNHFLAWNKSQINISWIALMSILALLSQEAGLVVILYCILASLHLPLSGSLRFKIIIVSVIVIVSYIGLRFLVFGSQANSYMGSGYASGSHYDTWSALSLKSKVFAGVENILTNLAAIILPVFNWEGKRLWFSEVMLVENILIWFPTGAIFLLSCTRRPTTLQIYALIIIVLNSVLHFAAFRYRFQYISWLGVCFFVASSLNINDCIHKRILLTILASILLLNSTLIVGNSLRLDWLTRYKSLNYDELRTEIYNFRKFGNIDANIVDQVLTMYKTNSK